MATTSAWRSGAGTATPPDDPDEGVNTVRVGTGYDSHRFDPSRPLILGGTEIPDHPGLRGHSDGDAIAHAVTDAILGAAALGDIGALYPPSDDRWAGADSMDLLAGALVHVHSAGWRVGNVDVTVVAESPRLRPWVEAIRGRLADVLGLSHADVSVKGKTNEGMGWIGAGEGLAVHAVALLHRPEPAGA